MNNQTPPPKPTDAEQESGKGLDETLCCASSVEREFRAELQALLDKWGAEMEAKDHWQGYAECGEDIRITVDIPGIWNADHKCVREYVEIDLGSLIQHNADVHGPRP